MRSAGVIACITPMASSSPMRVEQVLDRALRAAAPSPWASDATPNAAASSATTHGDR